MIQPCEGGQPGHNSKRGCLAMNDMGILPHFEGILCHDHWQPYFIYQCSHALCNAHHLRELQRIIEEDCHQWAIKMRELLLKNLWFFYFLFSTTQVVPFGVSSNVIPMAVNSLRTLSASAQFLFLRAALRAAIKASI